MEQTTQELQSHINSQLVPQPPQNIDIHDLATQQVHQVPNLDPSQTQLATFLATLQIKSDHEVFGQPHTMPLDYHLCPHTSSYLTLTKELILLCHGTSPF